MRTSNDYISVKQGKDIFSFRNLSGNPGRDWIETISIFQLNGKPYMNSMNQDILIEIARRLGLSASDIITLHDRSRQYGNKIGFALPIDVSWRVTSLKKLLRIAGQITEKFEGVVTTYIDDTQEYR